MWTKSVAYVMAVAVLLGCSDDVPTTNRATANAFLAAAQRDDNAALLRNMPIDESTFTGSLSITHIAYDEGSRRLLFSGTVTRASDGLTDSFTDVPGTLNRAASAFASRSSTVSPAQARSNGSCNFLVLAIQPLSLDLMGLILELSIIRIDLNAVPGPDKSLGNFLCSLARLLDSAAATTRAIQTRLDLINRRLATA
jgi:hypothetical protein